jgi:hypothetical protein
MLNATGWPASCVAKVFKYLNTTICAATMLASKKKRIADLQETERVPK